MTTGHQLAIDGQDSALAAAIVGHHNHLTTAHHTITQWANYSARRRTAFSADDVRADLPPETVAWIDTHHQAWSALWAQARRTNLIHAVGWTNTKRRQRHGNPNRLWRGTEGALHDAA